MWVCDHPGSIPLAHDPFRQSTQFLVGCVAWPVIACILCKPHLGCQGCLYDVIGDRQKSRPSANATSPAWVTFNLDQRLQKVASAERSMSFLNSVKASLHGQLDSRSLAYFQSLHTSHRLPFMKTGCQQLHRDSGLCCTTLQATSPIAACTQFACASLARAPLTQSVPFKLFPLALPCLSFVTCHFQDLLLTNLCGCMTALKVLHLYGLQDAELEVVPLALKS